MHVQVPVHFSAPQLGEHVAQKQHLDPPLGVEWVFFDPPMGAAQFVPGGVQIRYCFHFLFLGAPEFVACLGAPEVVVTPLGVWMQI